MSFPNPFGPVESPDTARSMARLSVWGFWLWAVVCLAQATFASRLVGGATGGPADAAVGMTVISALLAVALGGLQLRRPNRFVPILGLAWSLYELSAMAVATLVGAPASALDIPTWAAGLGAIAIIISLVLHIGALRGAAGMARMADRQNGRKS